MYKIRKILFSILMLSALALYPLDRDTTAWSGHASSHYHTPLSAQLQALPPPKSKVIAAVYSFTDQTGQYKPAVEGNNYSKAVTQGADSMVIKALLDSHWFVVVERSGLQNLINERKIVDLASLEDTKNTAASSTFTADNPLIYSHILIEGGIIAYETNIVTGGEGLRYLGIGGHDKYRRDQVTVFLRAVSVRTGQVLKIVHAKKSILSVMVDFSVYRFFDERKLIEIEAGASFNEPPQLCVKEAIERAVLGLVIEGITDKLWELANPEDITAPIISNYLEEEKRAIGEMNKREIFSPYLGIGLNFGLLAYRGDYTDLNLNMGSEVSITLTPAPFLTVFLKGGILQFGIEEKFDTSAIHLDAGARFNFKFDKKFKTMLLPYLSFGLGTINFWIKDQDGNLLERNDAGGGWKFTLSAAAGLEYFMYPQFGISSSLFLHYPFTDQMDGRMNGEASDLFWGLAIGLKYNFILS